MAKNKNRKTLVEKFSLSKAKIEHVKAQLNALAEQSVSMVWDTCRQPCLDRRQADYNTNLYPAYYEHCLKRNG